MLYLPKTVLRWMDMVAAVSVEMGRRSQRSNSRHRAIGLRWVETWDRSGEGDAEGLNVGESNFEEYTDDLN
jgi:hypothetical protein